MGFFLLFQMHRIPGRLRSVERTNLPGRPNWRKGALLSLLLLAEQVHFVYPNDSMQFALSEYKPRATACIKRHLVETTFDPQNSTHIWQCRPLQLSHGSLRKSLTIITGTYTL